MEHSVKEYVESRGIDESQVFMWPDSQVIMEFDWFDEAELINDEIGCTLFGGSAYIVPEERVKELESYILK